MEFVIKYSWLIPLLPLFGAVIAGFFGARWLKGNSHWPIWIAVGISAILSLTLLFGMLGHVAGTHSAHSEPGELESLPFFQTASWYKWLDTSGETSSGPAKFDPAGNE